MCVECVRRHNIVECSVYVRRGWLYACVGYCNSPLNNKNIDYHCPMVFSHIGFPHKSLCQLCDYCCVLFGLMFSVFCSVLLVLPTFSSLIRRPGIENFHPVFPPENNHSKGRK
jgi:hypothetical protein